MKTLNNQLLIKIAEAIAKGNLAFAETYLADNIRWNILGETPIIGKEQVLEVSKMSQLQSFPVIKIKNVIAAKNYVVIESTGKAITKSRQPYSQAYCDIFTFDGEQLQEITTYLDTAVSRTIADAESAIEIIRQLYAGINRNDIDFVLNLMDSNVIRIEFEGFPQAGTYRGHTEMRQHLINGRSTWAEGACEPVDFFTAENKIVVTVHIKVRLNNHPEWIDAWIADGFIIKEDRVAEFHSFPDNQKAFEWAGMNLDIS